MSFSLVGSLFGLISWVLATIGLPGLFVLMLVSLFGIPPLPSEIILPFAGFLVASGSLPLDGTVVAATVGGLVGSYVAYAVGRWCRPWLSRATGRLSLSPEHLEAMDRWFARRGEVTVGLARMAPLIRAYISYPAGAARMNPTRFGVFTFLGSLPYTGALLYAGFVLRSHWATVESWFGYLDDAVIAGVVVFAIVLVLRWRREARRSGPTPSTGPPRPEASGPPSTTGPGSPRS